MLGAGTSEGQGTRKSMRPAPVNESCIMRVMGSDVRPLHRGSRGVKMDETRANTARPADVWWPFGGL